jgi:hypothetical protein
MAKTNLSQSVTPAVEAPHVASSVKELAKERLNKFIEEERKLVKGIFKCFESPGSTQKIVVRKYPGIQPFEKEMTDGMSYEIPLYVARHLNGVDVTAGAMGDANKKNPMIGTCSYPIHGFKWNNGDMPPNSQIGDRGIPVPIVGVQKRFQRYGFQSLEFGAAIE